MGRALFILAVCLLASPIVFGQRIITGVVEDFDTGETLPFANVFVNNSTLGTATDQAGKFSITLPPEVKVVLVVAYVGYAPEEVTISSDMSKEVQLKVRLKATKEELQEVSVTANRDEDWQKNIEDFKRVFLGAGANSSATTIENPGVIDLQKSKGRLVAKCEEPIKIENRALGYKITYYLRDFASSPSAYRIYGLARFEEMESRFQDERSAWTLNRHRTFNGSLTHFLQSLIAGTYEQEGFEIYYTNHVSGPEAPIVNFVRNSASVEVARPNVIRLDSQHVQIQFKGKLEIHYLREASTQRAYRNLPYQVSMLEALNGQLICLKNGLVPDITNYQLVGDMASHRISDLLPSDYLPPELPVFSGRVVDKNNRKPIRDADVFINRSSFHAQTDWSGSFKLINVDSAYHQLIISAPGYEPLQVDEFIGGMSQNQKVFEMNRAPSSIGRLPAKDKLYQRVRQQIAEVAGSRTASDSILVNAEGTFGLFKSGKSVRVVFQKPVTIQNRKTGYNIFVYPSSYFLSKNTLTFDYYWFSSSTGPDANQRLYFEDNRLQAYWGSTSHFLKSLVAGKLNENGFETADWVGQRDDFLKGDSQGYVAVDVTSLKSLQFTRITQLADLTRAPQTQVKTVAYAGGQVKINSRGLLWPSGRISIDEFNVASSLPINYTPPYTYQHLYDATPLQEKPHVMSDKFIFYPGERVNISVFMEYSSATYSDSLSRVLYLDLVDTTGRVLYQSRAVISDGLAAGTFALSDTEALGAYRVRAYTQWMLNFGEPSSTTIWVIAPGTRASVPGRPLAKHEAVQISLNKKVFRPREKVEVHVQLTPGERVETISVVDQERVNDQPLEKNELGRLAFRPWTYPMEWFLHYRGEVLGAREIKTLMAYNQADSSYADVRMDGPNAIEFWTNDFFDSARFTFSVIESRKMKSVQVELAKTTPPACQPWRPTTQLVFEREKKVPIYSAYIPKDDILLKEVTVRSRRIEESMKPKSMSSKADPNSNAFILTSDQIGDANHLALGVAGRVPGLQVNCGQRASENICDVFFLRGLGGGSPLVIIDDVPMPLSPAGEVLSSIDVSVVDRVEFMSQVNPVYGLLASGGVILVYTKGYSAGEALREKTLLPTQFVAGFKKHIGVTGPDYQGQDLNLGDPDFRSTLYWNPAVVTDEKGKASVSFFAGDAQRRYKVTLWVRDRSGQLVKSEDVIEVKR